MKLTTTDSSRYRIIRCRTRRRNEEHVNATQTEPEKEEENGVNLLYVEVDRVMVMINSAIEISMDTITL